MISFKSATVFLLGTVFISLSAPVVQAAEVETLLPHRAVYDLSLKDASDRSGIAGMNGRIVYEMTGSVCEGFAVRFRFFTEVQTARKSFTNDQRTTSFESGDGRTFSFVNQSYLNGQLEQELKGRAERANNKTKISITKPQDVNIELDDAIFMTQHIGLILEAARKEQTFVTATVFDASNDGDELVDTTAIVGKKRAVIGELKGEPKEVAQQFDGQAGWPVSVSYFNTTSTESQGEKLPVYQVSFILHENGVSRDLKMQYDDYSLRGELKNIEFLKQDSCQ